MNRILDLIVFIIVAAVLWWALTAVLTALAVPAPFSTLAVVAFVVLAVLSIADYFRSGTWFFRR
jgi:uncharacterized membrane protein YwzB